MPLQPSAPHLQPSTTVDLSLGVLQLVISGHSRSSQSAQAHSLREFTKRKKRVASELCDKEKLSDSFMAIGESYQKLRKFGRSIKWYTKSWEIYKSIGNLETLDSSKQIPVYAIHSTRIIEPTALNVILTDDIALSCLARVPRKYHTLLRSVSKRWSDLVCSEEWQSYRLKHKLSETWIYALCRDKFEQVCCYVLDPNSSRRCWKPIQGLPPRTLKRKGIGFEVLGKKVYLLGGCGWSEDASNEVYCYDASGNTWSDAAPLATARCYFASEVLDEKIYVIGGLGSNSSSPHSWETYDPCTSNSKYQSDPNIVPEIEDSIVMDRKIYIRCTFVAPSHVHAVAYEPSSGTWQPSDADMVSGWQGPAVVVEGTLYVLDQSSGTRLIMWQKETREWVPVGRLSPLLTRPPCQIVAIGKSIFVVGKGLSTVVIDVGNAGNVEGVLLSSSIPKFKLTSDDDVISCKCLAI